jgi:hypothetical protein
MQQAIPTMKTRLLVRTAFAAVFFTSATLYAEDAAVTAKLAKFPPTAAEALKKAAGTATIEAVSIEKDGKVTLYEADLVEAGQPNREVSVTADGKIQLEEEAVPLEKLPAALRKAIETGAKGAKIERINRIKRASGEVTYEPLYVLKGKKTEVEYLEDGKVKPEVK